MTAPSGLSAQWMMVEEVTYGTYVAPARSLDLVSETVKLKVERVESMGLRAGRRMTLSPQWAAGKRYALGDVNTEVANVNQGLLWKHMLGSVVTCTGRSVADGVTNGTATITSATAAFVSNDVGQPISGSADIPAGTTIASVTNATTAVMSATATGSHSAQSFIINGGTGTYAHVCTPGDLTAKSMTHQFGRPDVGGTVRPFSYLGCKFNTWEVACKAGAIPTIKLGLVAQDETTANALTTAAYPALMVPLTFVGGSFSLAGTVVPVKDCTLKAANTLDPSRFMIRAAATPLEQLENGWRVYSGAATPDFSSLALYNYYTGANEVALKLTFAGGLIAGSTLNYSTVITQNVRFDPDATPNIAGPQLLAQPLAFKAVAPGATDGTGVTVTFTTSDATP